MANRKTDLSHFELNDFHSLANPFSRCSQFYRFLFLVHLDGCCVVQRWTTRVNRIVIISSRMSKWKNELIIIIVVTIIACCAVVAPPLGAVVNAIRQTHKIIPIHARVHKSTSGTYERFECDTMYCCSRCSRLRIGPRHAHTRTHIRVSENRLIYLLVSSIVAAAFNVMWYIRIAVRSLSTTIDHEKSLAFWVKWKMVFALLHRVMHTPRSRHSAFVFDEINMYSQFWKRNSTTM